MLEKLPVFQALVNLYHVADNVLKYNQGDEIKSGEFYGNDHLCEL